MPAATRPTVSLLFPHQLLQKAVCITNMSPPTQPLGGVLNHDREHESKSLLASASTTSLIPAANLATAFKVSKEHQPLQSLVQTQCQTIACRCLDGGLTKARSVSAVVTSQDPAPNFVRGLGWPTTVPRGSVLFVKIKNAHKGSCGPEKVVLQYRSRSDEAGFSKRSRIGTLFPCHWGGVLISESKSALGGRGIRSYNGRINEPRKASETQLGATGKKLQHVL